MAWCIPPCTLHGQGAVHPQAGYPQHPAKPLSKEEKQQVSRLALFVGVYFGIWFLECGLASIAPYKTITSFEQMVNFSEFDIQLAFTVMDSMRRHTWYITEQWVVVCLADTHCPEEERKAVATA